ncbi:hypothetical protein NDU88_004627 [Pleurodeles waltl]|uniref:Uncharacterized protein n=1 Tax=Pleurodeles waltl TaxID=8319 RepID=A0AAV7KYY6_PLEWA|nr:hypothetical protein NDU88_004627 [Pleurodeles waltl]
MCRDPGAVLVVVAAAVEERHPLYGAAKTAAVADMRQSPRCGGCHGERERQPLCGAARQLQEEVITFKAFLMRERKKKIGSLQKEFDHTMSSYELYDDPIAWSRLQNAKTQLKDFFLAAEIVNRSTCFQQYYEESEHVGKCLAHYAKKRQNA